MYLPEQVDWSTLEEWIDRDGRAESLPEWLDKDLGVSLYEDMVRMRIFDRRATAAQRQGRLGTYAIAEGHEAVQIGTARALAEHDFIYPGYREHGVHLSLGMPLTTILSYWRGLPNTPGIRRPIGRWW